MQNQCYFWHSEHICPGLSETELQELEHSLELELLDVISSISSRAFDVRFSLAINVTPPANRLSKLDLFTPVRIFYLGLANILPTSRMF